MSLNRYLITGGAGFIGSNIANYLLNNGHFVTILDNISTGFQHNIDFLLAHPKAGTHLTVISGDIRNFNDCHSACSGIEYVLHQAALGSVPRSINEPILYEQNNIGGTLNMLEASRLNHVKQFVFASSSSVYGNTPTLPKIESMPNMPRSPYALTKLTGEYYCKLYWDLYQLPTVSLRYFNIFGPRQNPASQYAAVIPKFITSFLKNESPVIYGDGEQTRDFTFIDNVIQANLKAAHANENAYGKAFNIGCGGRISLNHLADSIKKITKSNAPISYSDPRPGDVKDSMASIALAETHLGICDFVSLESGLKQTVKWYKENLV